MNKFERLLFIISEINRRRCMTVREIADSCGVTERTVYRDIRSLHQANVPLYYDKGYRLARAQTFDFVDLDAKDLELISYCINSNPLIDYSYFRPRLRFLDNLLLGSRPDIPGDHRALLFENGHSCSTAKESQDGNLVSKVFFAILEKFKISIHLEDCNSTDRLLIPVGLKATSVGLMIKARKSPRSTVREIPLANVRAITVSSQKFA